ncbi:hypothetical protein SDRG_09684 [Saprolegnia diclina VS20]|uniref:Uncharacterized protein n=1 Tax=Saprolegnia diclina (strain VS20) TaxID=1156394 RepID=T0QD88_SAPDV|nr:hypothetical protein SDRG_09684 [Saprolegnia diclina VS20]EQC32711.1 hypothetical protein SDRG_09684 [Saprolegnia diclina VS20]|eukprot:XP_008613855.1 hypothetical protein SDRG_09684 [Saprolegnia diclina VS20]
MHIHALACASWVASQKIPTPMAGTTSLASPAPTIAVAEVRHGSVTKKIAVYEKMRPSELNLMLHAAFFAQGAPEWTTDAVGFVHAKTKTFIPLALGTAFPTLFQPNHTYELVLAKAATTTPAPVVPPSSRPWTEQLYALLSQWSATSPSALSPDQLNRLELLIGQGHPVLRQAFATYEADKSLDGLYAAVHRVLGVVLQQQKSSFTRVVNTLSVLKPHDIALIHELYTQGNELVLAAWEVYELDEDRMEFADTLLRIVRFKSPAVASPSTASPSVLVTALSMEDVLKEMQSRSALTSLQYQGLLRLWRAKNDAMVGAMEAFQVDHDLKELVETLLLVVKHAGLTKQKPTPISVPRIDLDELHPLSPKAQDVRSPPSYGTFVPGSAPSTPVQGAARTSSSLSARSTPSAKPVAKAAPASNLSKAKPNPKAKPALHVATSLPDDVGSPANLILSPSHYPPNSTELYIAQLLERLVASSDLSAGQQMALKTLIKKQDARLFAAATSFQHDGDKAALLPLLHDLCGVLNWEANHQSILYTWIVPLEQDGRGAGLRDLWDANDPRLMAAYFLFLQDRNEDDFTDTLLRLATSTPPASDLEVAKDALDDLVTAGRLSQDVEAHLAPEDPRVLAALDVYADSLDIPDLVDTLERIASPSTVASPLSSPRAHDEDTSRVDMSVMEKQILHLVYELDLPDDELLALKTALVENDVVVQAAIQVFETEKDEEDFKDTLRRVARHRASASEAVPDAETEA